VKKERARVAARFSANLTELRHQAGLTQAELAKRTGLHRTEVSYLERRQRLPRVDIFLRLCDGLEVSPNRLLNGVEWRWDKQKFAIEELPQA
jgi:transcriptional regulator with XRE-family HTH domain